MKEKKQLKSVLLTNMRLLREQLEEQRLRMVYLEFDVECCRRERDYYKKIADGK